MPMQAHRLPCIAALHAAWWYVWPALYCSRKHVEEVPSLQALTYARPGDPLMLKAVPGWAAAFPYVLMCHLRDDRDDTDLRASLKASMQAGLCRQATVRRKSATAAGTRLQQK